MVMPWAPASSVSVFNLMPSLPERRVERQSKKIEEQGICTVTETEVTLIPADGETRTVSYALLKSDPIYDLSITDEKGVEWNFLYFAWFGHVP